MGFSKNDTINFLQNGLFTIKGEFLWGSNYTFLSQLEIDENVIAAVYKPSRGERPLWDFPPESLAKREVAAYLVSEALGWELVPPTVYRQDAPLGSGSMQLFIDHDPEYHYFNFKPDDLDRLRPVVLFDMVINNADRKGSHILFDKVKHLWCIDHGVSFHNQDKLRTVIWDFIGDAIPEELFCDLIRFKSLLQSSQDQNSELIFELSKYISILEIESIQRRIEQIIKIGVFPSPDPHRRAFPWPQV